VAVYDVEVILIVAIHGIWDFWWGIVYGGAPRTCLLEVGGIGRNRKNKNRMFMKICD
jgi:hypothetical protein